MLHPVGRLPSQIYWRRRLLLIVLVVAIGITAVVLTSNGSSGASGDGTGAIVAQTSSAEATDDRFVPGLEQVVPSLVPAESGSSGGSGSGTGSGDSGTATPGSGAPGTTSSAPPPAEPGPCPDEAIGLTVASEFGQYAAGSKPLLSMTIANVSAVPCYRDLNLVTQVWGLFTTDGTRLWGSNDCFPEPDVPNSQLLQPGQAQAFSIIWSGLTSEPGCPATRQVLGPGTYVLRGHLLNLFSPDVPLVIV